MSSLPAASMPIVDGGHVAVAFDTAASVAQVEGVHVIIVLA